MAINVSVLYSTVHRWVSPRYDTVDPMPTIGEPDKIPKRVFSLQLTFPPKRFDNFLMRWMLRIIRALDAFRFYFKT